VKAGAAGAGRGASLLWAQGLVCGGLVAARPGLALLALLLFWPVGVIAALDRAPGRPALRSAALWAAAAGFAPLRAAWDNAGPDPLSGLLGDGHALWIAWGATGWGWALAQGAPVLAESAEALLRARRAVRLRAERAALLEAWRLTV